MSRNNSVYGLGSVLSELLRGMDFETKIKEHTCLAAWDEVVGERVANSAQPDFIRDGLMFVTTKSPVWANELNLYKREMISKINAKVGSTILKDIVFKSGRMSHRRAKEINIRPDTVDLEGIKLTDEEIEKIETISSAAGIEVSGSMKEMLITAARLEKWKKSKGWKSCSRCGSLHGSSSDLCPVCAIQPK
jgi:hypothetical protein